MAVRTVEITPIALVKRRFNTNTYGGVVTVDTQAAALPGAPALTSPGTVANASVTGSPYAISIAAGGLGNAHGYTINYSAVPGQLTVTPASLTVTAYDAARNYGDVNPGFSVRYAGFRLGETQAHLNGTLLFNTPANGASLPGLYAIHAAGQSSSNYTLTYVPGQLTVIGRATTPIDPQMSAQNLLLSMGTLSGPARRADDDPTFFCGDPGPTGSFACIGR